MSHTPIPILSLAPPEVLVEQRADGSMILRSPQTLQFGGNQLLEWLIHHAQHHGDRLFLAERAGEGTPENGREGWRSVTYAQALEQVRSLAQALLDRGVGPARPLMILSDNGVDHGLLTLAGMYIGAPVVPVSPAYSLMSQDFGRLKYIAQLVRPGLVYAVDGVRFAPALRVLRGLELPQLHCVVSGAADVVPGLETFAQLLETSPRPAIDEALATIGPDTVAKLLFTSGSTGVPKGVLNTHTMMLSNQQALFQLWPFLQEVPPVLVEWLPWSHTFGGNHNFNLVIRHGGTLYIDDGKPAPGLIEKTVQNLTEQSPTLYFNVPRGYDMLLPHLEGNEAFREAFFRRLQVLFFAAAALPQPLWERLIRVSERVKHREIQTPLRMLSGWGSTETAPLATSVHFPIDRSSVIGLPAVGTTIKLAPVGSKLELRVKGPNVTPGYFQRPELTQAAFDDEGFYKTGDAGRLIEPSNPSKGLTFDGRIAEDFKLMSGTWVHVGALRVTLVGMMNSHSHALIQDAVIVGHDREAVGALLFPNPVGIRHYCPELPPETPLAEVLKNTNVLSAVRQRLSEYNAQHPGTSLRISRAMFLLDPPSIDAGEITDKGYINQRAVLEHRANAVAQVFSEPASAEVLVM